MSTMQILSSLGNSVFAYKRYLIVRVLPASRNYGYYSDTIQHVIHRIPRFDLIMKFENVQLCPHRWHRRWWLCPTLVTVPTVSTMLASTPGFQWLAMRTTKPTQSISHGIIPTQISPCNANTNVSYSGINALQYDYHHLKRYQMITF